MRSRLLTGAANVAHLAGLSRRPLAAAPAPARPAAARSGGSSAGRE